MDLPDSIMAELRAAIERQVGCQVAMFEYYTSSCCLVASIDATQIRVFLRCWNSQRQTPFFHVLQLEDQYVSSDERFSLYDPDCFDKVTNEVIRRLGLVADSQSHPNRT